MFFPAHLVLGICSLFSTSFSFQNDEHLEVEFCKPKTVECQRWTCMHASLFSFFLKDAHKLFSKTCLYVFASNLTPKFVSRGHGCLCMKVLLKGLRRENFSMAYK